MDYEKILYQLQSWYKLLIEGIKLNRDIRLSWVNIINKLKTNQGYEKFI